MLRNRVCLFLPATAFVLEAVTVAALDWGNVSIARLCLNTSSALLKYCGCSSGRLKCPLQSTNKRFLLNTLRSTGPPKHTAETQDGSDASRRRSRSNSVDRKRDSSRSPFRDRTSKGGHTDHKHHQRDSCNNRDKRRDGDRERRYRHKDNREWKHGRDTCRRAKDWEKNVQRRNTASFTRTTPSTGRQSRTVRKLLSGQLTWREARFVGLMKDCISGNNIYSCFYYYYCWYEAFVCFRFVDFSWFLLIIMSAAEK